MMLLYLLNLLLNLWITSSKRNSHARCWWKTTLHPASDAECVKGLRPSVLRHKDLLWRNKRTTGPHQRPRKKESPLTTRKVMYLPGKHSCCTAVGDRRWSVSRVEVKKKIRLSRMIRLEIGECQARRPSAQRFNQKETWKKASSFTLPRWITIEKYVASGLDSRIRRTTLRYSPKNFMSSCRSLHESHACSEFSYRIVRQPCKTHLYYTWQEGKKRKGVEGQALQKPNWNTSATTCNKLKKTFPL